jgi:hypothetical protein
VYSSAAGSRPTRCFCPHYGDLFGALLQCLPDTDGLEMTVRRSVAAAGSAVLFLVAPTMVTVLGPWLLTGWQVGGS